MKKTLLFFIALVVLSCSKDDDSNQVDAQRQDLIDRVHGKYRLRAARTDVPIDINRDGEAQTDLFEEIRYCGNALILSSYYCKFTHNSTYDKIYIKVPTSEYLNQHPVSTCIREKGIGYPFEFDVPNQTVHLVQSDHWDEFAATFNTEILEVTWEDGWAYFKLGKKFYNSDGEWQDVILYLDFEKTTSRI